MPEVRDHVRYIRALGAESVDIRNLPADAQFEKTVYHACERMPHR